jgi:hypothetical protein
MSPKEAFAEDVKGVGRFVGHAVALIVGLLLLVISMAMGVSLVLLPAGVIVALTGFFLIVAGLHTDQTRVHIRR